MSRKRKAPVRKVYPDPKFRSELVSKFINSISPDVKIFSWTIRNKRALKEALKRSQNITFEGFIP